ncbi:hypothetical protein CDAR_13771 [Caerostris darwini]|uniref:Uncharacterized protein n=1 Tax=Caerostris darwini TaxID=1538125 RepID=A0AAV4U7X3_9ARAC|nr:hypothetical protein CDAR_13771 [Caerostris darwini]
MYDGGESDLGAAVLSCNMRFSMGQMLSEAHSATLTSSNARHMICLINARVRKRGRQGRDTDGRSRADRSGAVIRRSLFCAVGKNAGAHVMDVAKEENFTPANPINFAKQFSFALWQ